MDLYTFMIHPHTELRFVNDLVGYGVFATRFIPKGTVIYTEDPLDRVIHPAEYAALPALFQPIVKRLSYVDVNGNYVLCWDIAKYMNHRCECNTLSTAYGFDLALQDIQPGDELTGDYGLLNLEVEMILYCECNQCRLVLTPDDFDRLYPDWDVKIRVGLEFLNSVPQPLLLYIDPDQWTAVQDYLRGQDEYWSVLKMKFQRT